MKFEHKGKWIKQINEIQGATLNGTDDIELEFDPRHSKVYITINGDLTYVVDEDKFNENVSNFIYNEVNKDKTKFNLNWFKHFGKLNRYLRKVESAQKNESDLSISAMLDFSLSEENDAVANYEKRAAKCLEHGNTKLADLFKELARDEKIHVAQLTKAKELLGLADNEIEQEGSDEAKEILLNKGE